MNQILPLIQALGIGVVLPAVAAWLAPHIKQKWLREALIGVVRRGAGVGYDYLASRSAGMDPATARRNAFAAAINYVETAGPAYIRALGVQSDVVEGMVRGELGQLFAQDQTITVADKIQPATFDALSAPVVARADNLFPLKGPQP